MSPYVAYWRTTRKGNLRSRSIRLSDLLCGPLVHCTEALATVTLRSVLQGLENLPALDEGSILCTEERKLLGRVDDILGPVTQPVYVVRYCGAGTPPVGLMQASRVFRVSGRSCLFDANVADTFGPARDWDEAVDGGLDSDEEGLAQGGVDVPPHTDGAPHVGKKRGAEWLMPQGGVEGGSEKEARSLAQHVGRGGSRRSRARGARRVGSHGGQPSMTGCGFFVLCFVFSEACPVWMRKAIERLPPVQSEFLINTCTLPMRLRQRACGSL